MTNAKHTQLNHTTNKRKQTKQTQHAQQTT